MDAGRSETPEPGKSPEESWGVGTGRTQYELLPVKQVLLPPKFPTDPALKTFRTWSLAYDGYMEL